jgi:hypothetical protein
VDSAAVVGFFTAHRHTHPKSHSTIYMAKVRERNGERDMPKKSKNQNEEEIYIFNRFVEASGIQVIPDSIKKLEPLNPDIFCELIDGTTLAVEITEITDRGLSKGTSDQLALQKYLKDYYTKYPIPALADAYIVVEFADDLTLQQRRQAVKPLFQLLQTLPSNYSGEIDVKQSMVSNIVTRLHIDRFDLVKPEFDVSLGTSIADMTMSTLMNKLRNKHYETDAKRLELLAYYGIYPSNFDTGFEPNIEGVKSHIRASQFNKVWIFDLRSEQVQWKYPNDDLSE